VKELCEFYMQDLDQGRILGKRGLPKKDKTKVTDLGRIKRHIIPLIGKKMVTQLTKADVTVMMKDIMAGKTGVNEKTGKLRGKSIVRGGHGTASRTVGLLGGILTYARDELGIIETNPAHGIRKPKDSVRTRRLSETEYRALGRILDEAEQDDRYAQSAKMIRLLAITGCRRGEIIALRWEEVDGANSCLRLEDTKEGQSVRPIGLAALELLEERHKHESLASPFVFPGRDIEQPTGSFVGHWDKILTDTELEGVTAHILRHSFASLANDLGLTEITIAALLGHASGSITSRYVHSLDVALVMAADTVAGYIKALMDGEKLTHTSYALDRNSRKAALASFLAQGQQVKTHGRPPKKLAV
jgi:integrase